MKKRRIVMKEKELDDLYRSLVADDPDRKASVDMIGQLTYQDSQTPNLPIGLFWNIMERDFFEFRKQ